MNCFANGKNMSFCSKKFPADGQDEEIDGCSAKCSSARHKTGNYNGILVFVKFIETESLTLTRDDLLELKLASARCTHASVHYLRQLNEVNGGDNVFVRRVSVCVSVSVCVCAADR